MEYSEIKPFVDNVNAELPNRPSIPVPPGGALTAGMAMIATGVGMGLTQKLVEFQNPLLVRYVGDQVGDYADLKLAIESLPVGVNDISTKEDPYRIYVRKSINDHPSGIVNSANSLIIEGVNTIDTPSITISFKVDNNDYCIKTIHGSASLQYLHLISIQLKVLANSFSNTILSTDFSILDFSDIAENTWFYMSFNAKLYLTATTGYHQADGKLSLITCSNTATTNKYFLMNFALFGVTSYYLFVTDGYGAILSCRDSFLGVNGIYSPTDNSSSTYISATIGGAKEHRLIHAKSYSSGTSIYKFINMQVNISISSTTSGTCKFLFLDTPNGLKHNVVFASMQYNNGTLSNDRKIYLVHNKYNKPIEVGFHNCSDMRTVNYSSFGTKAKIVDAGYLTVTESGSFLPTIDMSQVAHLDPTTQQAVSSYAMSNTVTHRAEGKTYSTQSPLPPVSPKPGDVWIMTKEQY